MKQLFLAAALVILGIAPACAQGNWVYGNPMQPAYQCNSNGPTIKYYPPVLGTNSSIKNNTTRYFYQIPSRIEPSEQPNPLKDEMERTDYV